MWTVYILKSTLNRYYIGFTGNIEVRINQHNSGLTLSTKFGIPWSLIYKEEFNSKSDAIKREKQIRSYHGGNEFKKLIGGVA